MLGNGIFTQEGASWKHSRDLLRKQFIRIKSQNFEHFHENVDNLIDRLPSNGMVDMQPLFLDLTLDIATGLLFGRSVYALRAGIDQDKENKSFSESFKIAQEGLAKRFRIAPWHFFYNPPAFRKACGNVHRFVERYIKSFNSEEAKINEKNNCGFIKQVAEEFRDTTELRDQLLNVLLAGRDTTACCLSWTLFVSLRIWFWLFDYADFLWRILSRLLVRHPNVMGRLRREITTIMEASPTPSRDQIRKIPYLACVIKESKSVETRVYDLRSETLILS